MSSGNHLPNLDKIFRDEDEPDFLPSGGSNLAAIFGLQVKPSDNQPSLKQQIFKKPSSLRDVQQTIPNKTEVVIAKAVHAFKLLNGAYVSVGKLGMALTGNITTKVYQLILYKTKQDHISTATVTNNFLYLVQLNNYSSYYDNDKENWSILFGNNDTCLEFAKEVGLARYFSTDGEIENVLYQDLSPMNKEVIAKEGDNLIIKYYIASEIIQPFKCNITALQTMTVEISTDDNWERTLLGSSKGLKRILFLPPSKQISLGPGFPKEKDVMLEIEIIDIQTKKEAAQLHRVTSNKASIISRMAKMGQSMLPKIPASIPTDSEDTEDDIPYKSPCHGMVESAKEGFEKKHVSKENIQETRNIHKGPKSKGDMSSTNGACKPFVTTSPFNQWSSTQIQPNFVTLDGQVYSLQQQNVTPTISSMVDPGLNILLSETRMTNTELRMGMSKIADNVQKLLDKFHVLELQNATSPMKDQTALDATLRMFMTMNARQTGEKENYSQKSADDTVTKDFTDLNEMKSKISVLKEKLEESKEALSTKTEYIKSLENQKESLIEANENLNKKIQELEISLKETNHVNKTKRDLEENLKELNSKHIEEKAVLENKISMLVEECNSLTSAKSMAIQDNNNKNRDIKNIMNKIYHTLMDKFVDEVYSTSYIKLTIANTIKNTTFEILYNSDKGSNKEVQSMPVKVTEIDALKVTNTETEDASSTCTTQLSKEDYVSENISSTLIQDEPPPISHTDDDWPD